MLNLDVPSLLNISYFRQRDLFFKSFLYSVGVFTLINLLRAQISEINLLQLVPGFYLVLLFICFFFLILTSDFLCRFSLELDHNKSMGTKTLTKLDLGILIRLGLFLLVSSCLVTINNVIPVSLDSFDFYGEETLENLWSFDEVISLEINLLIIIIIISQLPIFTLGVFGTEKIVNLLPEFWKIVSFIIFLAAGFLTPTIDGYTQLSFSGSAIFLYLIVISLIQKRINIKFNGTTGLS